MDEMQTTRENSLQIGARIVRQKGFHSTGLNEILKEAQVPKGSFYFYFHSKEQSGLELIDVYSSFMEAEMNKVMSDSRQNGLQRLHNFFEFTKMMFSAEDFVGGCRWGKPSFGNG